MQNSKFFKQIDRKWRMKRCQCVVTLRLISFAICMRNAFVCFPQIFFLFCITNEAFFVCRASNSVCAVFKRNNFLYLQQNYKRRLSVPAWFHANDLHIFDFHVSEIPSKNVHFFILEKYTQKYYFRPLR